MFSKFLRRNQEIAPGVQIQEHRGVRSLHLGTRHVQSAMRIRNPQELELEYTRCMMAFPLFCEQPRDALMIGLGGGSVIRFLHAKMPEVSLITIENNEEVLHAARAWFNLPEDEHHVVHIGDGATYVATCAHAADVILVDAFDGHDLAPMLGSELFYFDCQRALREGGVLAVNLWGGDPRFDLWLNYIRAAFDGRVLCLPAKARGNVIAFGVNSTDVPGHTQLMRRARAMQPVLGLDLTGYVKTLEAINPFRIAMR
ncbi:MAG: spermidine synthase [Proteobacteria bacterium]|nr:spermidine synthase [Pseudomonadota bacterium]